MVGLTGEFVNISEMESVIKYLYNLVDSLRLRSPKKIRMYISKTNNQASPFATFPHQGLLRRLKIRQDEIPIDR
jgi:hypothetical protein